MTYITVLFIHSHTVSIQLWVGGGGLWLNIILCQCIKYVTIATGTGLYHWCVMTSGYHNCMLFTVLRHVHWCKQWLAGCFDVLFGLR